MDYVYEAAVSPNGNNAGMGRAPQVAARNREMPMPRRAPVMSRAARREREKKHTS